MRVKGEDFKHYILKTKILLHANSVLWSKLRLTSKTYIVRKYSLREKQCLGPQTILCNAKSNYAKTNKIKCILPN